MKKLTKGYIKNTRTGKIKKFMLNPTTYSTKRGVQYSEITSPGASYPIIQYSGGGSTSLKLKILLAYNKKEVEEWELFLNEFMPKDKFTSDFSPPSTLLFVYGKKVYECVLLDLDKEYQYFDNQLTPYVVEVNLDLKVVG